MMNKLLFIIGMRRSGTSILQRLIQMHPEVDNILFEPHELWFASKISRLSRYRNNPYIRKVIKDFSYAPRKYKGAKFAVNAGIEAMAWKCLHLRFPEAKFIFLIRNGEDTFKSWYKLDSNPKCVRGVVPKEMYMPWRNHIVDSFTQYTEQNSSNACIISYETLVKHTDKELLKVWKTLNIREINGFQSYMKKPNNWSNK